MTEKQELIITLREKGRGYKDIGDELGIDKSYVREVCQKFGLGGVIAHYTHKCRSCGKEFETTSKAQIFCSIECRSSSYKINSIRYSVERKPKNCLYCGNEFVPEKTNGQKYCCDRCKKDALNERERANRVYRDQAIHKTKFCPACGKEFITRNGHQKFCCLSCGKKYRRSGRLYRVSKDKRLMMCTEKDNSLWLLPLIKRDNNTCQICNGQCDLYDYEVSENGAVMCGDSYPSIDHIIPLSRGGQHIWSNAQLAHRGCNREKSDS